VKRLFLFILLLISVSTRAQLRPDELKGDDYVKIALNDSSSFYAVVLGKPLPDRFILETRYGRLEVPMSKIAYATDYRYNWVQREDLKRAALKNTADAQQYGISQFLSRPKMPSLNVVGTQDHNTFVGRRYIFDDSAHVILSTEYGNLFFKYPDLSFVDNWSGNGDRREVFATSTYLTVTDPMNSQTFILPTARAFGAGKAFINDYMVAGIQGNYGATDWLSINAGGALAPFLPTAVTAATAGIKITPLSTELWNVAAGFQGVYSKVVKINRIAFPYVAATYGTWESQLTLLGGYAIQETDSLGKLNTLSKSIIGASGDMRVGENLKLAVELYFIEDFGIVPTVGSVRYFDNNMTVDVGVVFSLYKAGSIGMKTLGEYVFNVNFPVIPLVSISYHF